MNTKAQVYLYNPRVVLALIGILMVATKCTGGDDGGSRDYGW